MFNAVVYFYSINLVFSIIKPPLKKRKYKNTYHIIYKYDSFKLIHFSPISETGKSYKLMYINKIQMACAFPI